MSHTYSNLKPLTRYPLGSLKELWTLAFPLMLTALSGTLMLSCDRLILARFSLEAMTAGTAAGTSVAIFSFGFIGIAGMAEIFVGQLNGAKTYKKVAEPVWQMIWFSLLATLIFLPLAFYADTFFVPAAVYEKGGREYFVWLMAFGCLPPLIAALSAFYIGIGKVKLVTYAAIFANILNAGLDILLVFGIPNYLEPMGVKGAAIGTILAEALQALILLTVFLKPLYRQTYNTHIFTFKGHSFWQIIKIGTPNAIGHIVEIGAWAFLMHMINWLDHTFAILMSLSQTIYILFSFLSDGMQKGVIAVGANFIGAQAYPYIKKVLFSAIKLHIICMLFLALPLLFYPELLLRFFLQYEKVDPSLLLKLQGSIGYVLMWVWISLCLDGLKWIIAGILTAGGDTKFVMPMQAIGAWLFAITPTYLFVLTFDYSPFLVWPILSCYDFLMQASSSGDIKLISG